MLRRLKLFRLDIYDVPAPYSFALLRPQITHVHICVHFMMYTILRVGIVERIIKFEGVFVKLT